MHDKCALGSSRLDRLHYISLEITAVQIRSKINIVDDRGEPFMGPGILDLLERIREYQSINRAAEQMSLSYVKALHMLNRKRGGNERGGSKLTRFGEKYIIEYSRLEKRVRRHVEGEFRIFRKRVVEADSGASS